MNGEKVGFDGGTACFYRKEKIEGFIQKKATPFGTGAKVDCPKEFLGRTVYLVVCKE